MNTRIKVVGQGCRRSLAAVAESAVEGFESVCELLKQTKREIAIQHRDLFQGRERLLKLALNEAEALAFQTDYPHLLYPQLALEKVEAALSWQYRQQLIRRNESAFAA